MSSERHTLRLPPIDAALLQSRGKYSEEEVAARSIMSDNGWAEYRSALNFDPSHLGKTILDVGVGKNARFVREAAKKGYNVAGVAAFLTDEGKPIAPKTRRLQRTHGTIVQALASALPFPDDTFDSCVSLYAISYIAPYLIAQRASQLYPELMRVLKPGGRTYIGRYSKKEYEFAKPTLQTLQEQGVGVRTILSHKWIDRRRYEPRYTVTLQKPPVLPQMPRILQAVDDPSANNPSHSI